MIVLDAVFRLFQKVYGCPVKTVPFESQEKHLIGGACNKSCAGVAQKLGMKEATGPLPALSMRRHFRYLLQVEIAQTKADPSQREEQLRHLITCLVG